jgi:SanA protein
MRLSRAAKPRSWLRLLGRALWSLALLVLLGVMGVVGVNWWMVESTTARVYTRVEDVPARMVGLVLGAGPGSLYLENRLDAAAQLYKAGKVRRLIVSGAGDPVDPTGSETGLMRLGLINRGVPAAAVSKDDYGWRTLDSVARAKKVFGLDAVVIVSQGFHLPRALFLARHWDLDAVGYAAADPASDIYNNSVREWLARVLAVSDVISGRQPRFTGPPVPARTP